MNQFKIVLFRLLYFEKVNSTQLEILLGVRELE